MIARKLCDIFASTKDYIEQYNTQVDHKVNNHRVRIDEDKQEFIDVYIQDGVIIFDCKPSLEKYIAINYKDENVIPQRIKLQTTAFKRSASVIAEAKIRAQGVCQLCGQKAPFCDKQGDPYLEVHHIIWLSRGGSDTLENVVALCPNCHSKMHIVDDTQDVKYLIKKIEQSSCMS